MKPAILAFVVRVMWVKPPVTVILQGAFMPYAGRPNGVPLLGQRLPEWRWLAHHEVAPLTLFHSSGGSGIQNVTVRFVPVIMGTTGHPVEIRLAPPTARCMSRDPSAAHSFSSVCVRLFEGRRTTRIWITYVELCFRHCNSPSVDLHRAFLKGTEQSARGMSASRSCRSGAPGTGGTHPKRDSTPPRQEEARVTSFARARTATN